MLQKLLDFKRIFKSALVLVNAIVPTFAGGQVDRWTWWWVACENFWRNVPSYLSPPQRGRTTRLPLLLTGAEPRDNQFFSQGPNHAITNSSDAKMALRNRNFESASNAGTAFCVCPFGDRLEQLGTPRRHHYHNRRRYCPWHGTAPHSTAQRPPTRFGTARHGATLSLADAATGTVS